MTAQSIDVHAWPRKPSAESGAAVGAGPAARPYWLDPAAAAAGALAAIERGWRVYPLWPDSKAPAETSARLAALRSGAARMTANEVRRRARRGQAFGVMDPPALVLDLDAPGGPAALAPHAPALAADLATGAASYPTRSGEGRRHAWRALPAGWPPGRRIKPGGAPLDLLSLGPVILWGPLPPGPLPALSPEAEADARALAAMPDADHGAPAPDAARRAAGKPAPAPRPSGADRPPEDWARAFLAGVIRRAAEAIAGAGAGKRNPTLTRQGFGFGGYLWMAPPAERAAFEDDARAAALEACAASGLLADDGAAACLRSWDAAVARGSDKPRAAPKPRAASPRPGAGRPEAKDAPDWRGAWLAEADAAVCRAFSHWAKREVTRRVLRDLADHAPPSGALTVAVRVGAQRTGLSPTAYGKGLKRLHAAGIFATFAKGGLTPEGAPRATALSLRDFRASLDKEGATHPPPPPPCPFSSENARPPAAPSCAPDLALGLTVGAWVGRLAPDDPMPVRPRLSTVWRTCVAALALLASGAEAEAAAVAARSGASIAATRAHLAKLEARGIMRRRLAAPAGRGRPAILWALAKGAGEAIAAARASGAHILGRRWARIRSEWRMMREAGRALGGRPRVRPFGALLAEWAVSVGAIIGPPRPAGALAEGGAL